MFLLGDRPGAIDAQFYHVIWFVRGRWDGGPAMLSEFASLVRWEDRVRAIGHGEMREMTPEDAIARAAACEPLAQTGEILNDPQGLTAGMKVTVSPDLDGGEQPVEGAVVAADAETITLAREDEEAGALHVHFPRRGYRVSVG